MSRKDGEEKGWRGRKYPSMRSGTSDVRERERQWIKRVCCTHFKRGFVVWAIYGSPAEMQILGVLHFGFTHSNGHSSPSRRVGFAFGSLPDACHLKPSGSPRAVKIDIGLGQIYVMHAVGDPTGPFTFDAVYNNRYCVLTGWFVSGLRLKGC